MLGLVESEETEGRVWLLGLLLFHRLSLVDSLSTILFVGCWVCTCRCATKQRTDAERSRFLTLLDLFSLFVFHLRLDLLRTARLAAELGRE